MPISHERDVDKLFVAFLKEIQSREMSSFMNYLRKDNKYRGPREADNFAGAAPFCVSNQSGPSFTIKCTYCRKSRKSHKCNLITDPQSRKVIHRAKCKSFICLRGSHERMSIKVRHHVSIYEQD